MLDLMPDFLQDFFEEFVNPQKRIFVGYLLSAFVLALVWLCIAERDSAKAAIKKIFDKNVWLSTSSLADFKIILVNRVIMSGTAAALVTQITISTFLYKLLHGQALIEPLALHFISAGSVAVIFTVFFFVFDDFSRFYVHRLMHRVPVLWAFHQVHHSAETMTPFTIFRTHPIEGFIFTLRTSVVQGIVISVFLFLFGSKVDLITVYGASVGVVIFHSLGSNLRHSHVKIRYPRLIELFFISPGQHQIHHSTEKRHFDKNFGVALAVWDLIFGSLFHSESQTHKFGLTTKFGEKHNLLHLYVEPFKAAIRIMKRTKISGGP
ncbi:sterol desaturase family protein [Alphaproteobacteria bacterium]|nr:sterol desaturase family protein [Alphaproteobacteria bacterium]